MITDTFLYNNPTYGKVHTAFSDTGGTLFRLSDCLEVLGLKDDENIRKKLYDRIIKAGKGAQEGEYITPIALFMLCAEYKTKAERFFMDIIDAADNVRLAIKH